MCHPEDHPPRLLETQKKHVGGGYMSRGQVKYFSEISCLTPPENSRVKGGDVFTSSTAQGGGGSFRIGNL